MLPSPSALGSARLGFVRVAVLLIFASLWATPIAASQYSIFLDTDDDPATGCTVSTVDGNFFGAELRATTTVDDMALEVTAVELETCNGGAFDPPVLLADFPTPWPVGLDLGTSGAEVVESYVPFADVAQACLRAGFTSDDEMGGLDALLNTTGLPGGPEIRFGNCATIIEIPTAGDYGLTLMALLLAIAAGLALRRHPSAMVWVLFVVTSSAAMVGVVVAAPGMIFMLDGDPAEWPGNTEAQASDPAGDVVSDADLIATFVGYAADDQTLFVRFDYSVPSVPPTAVDDVATVAEDAPATTIDVQLNDTDPDGGPNSVLMVTQPANGTVVITNSGADLTYQPDPDFCNDGVPTDDFTYTLNGGSTATVAVTVTCTDDPPVAVDDTATMLEDAAATAIDVLANDTDTDGGTMLVQSVVQPAGGTVVITGGGTGLTYQPDPDFCNDGVPTDDFTYTLNGGSMATVAVTVTCVNDEPAFIAGADETVAEDAGAQTVAGWATGIDDSDPEATQNLTFTVTNDNNALFSQQPDVDEATGNLTYTSAMGASGMATVSVFLMDDGGVANGGDDTSPTQMFTITVTNVDDPPTCTTTAGTTAFTEDAGAVTVDGGITVADPDSANLVSATVTVTNLLDATFETLAATTGGTSITAMYTAPTLSLTGSDTLANYQTVLQSLTYNNTDDDPDLTDRVISCVVNDGTSSSGAANKTVTITDVNDPPSVMNTTIDYDAVGNTLLRVDSADADNHDMGLPERVASTISLIEALTAAGASDPDSPAPVFIAEVAEATDQGGLLTLDDDGDLHYLPPIGFTGMDTETVVITDGEGGNVPVTLRFTVAEMIWYVEDTIGAKNPAGNADGRSTDAFQTLAAVEAASGPGDTILLFETDAPLDEGITLQSGQKFYGQRVEEEAVSLLPTGLLLEEIADTNARPQVHRGGGVAITVDASGGSLADVEIRHLDIESGDTDVIEVTTSGTNLVTNLLIDENVINSVGARGIDINSAHTSGDGSIAITDNQISSLTDGIDVDHTAAGNLAVAIDGNTGIDAGARGISVSETAGTLTVVSLDGNSVSGDTGGDGMVFEGVTFDADETTAAFDQVDANDTAIGAAANAVGGSGLVITGGVGDLLFDDLDIEAAGFGINANGTGEVNVGAGTGFRLTTGAGSSVVATGGPALDLDPLTAVMTLASISSSASVAQGVRVNDVAGTINIQGGSITGSTTAAVEIDQDTVTNALAFTYSGTIGNTSGSAIFVQGYPAGTITFNGASISDSGAGGNTGTGFHFEDVDGTINVSATTTTLTQSDGHGIHILGDSDGTINIDNTTVTNAAMTGIRVFDGADRLGGTFDFDNVDVNHATNATLLLDVQGLNNGSVSFDAASALAASDGSGVRVLSNAGTSSVTLAGPVDLGTGGSRLSDATAFDMAGNSAGTIVSIPDLDIFTSGQTAVNASGAGTLDLDALSVNTASNGRAIDLDGIHSQVDADLVVCSHSSDCVQLTSLAPASLTRLAGMNLTCTGGNCFSANAARTIESTGPGNAIAATNAVGMNVTNTTIGANDLNFASIASSGAVNGIILNATGTTGGLRVTGDGSTATQGGNGTGGTIANTTGIAIDVDNSADLRLQNMIVDTPASHGLDLSELAGTSRFDNITVDNVDTASTHGIRHQNFATAGASLTIDNSRFMESDTGAVMVLSQFRGNVGTTTVNVEDSRFDGLDPSAFQINGYEGSGTQTSGTLIHNFLRNTVEESDTDGVGETNHSCGGSLTCTFAINNNIYRNLAKAGNFNSGVLNAGYGGSTITAGSTMTLTIAGNRLSATDPASSGNRRGIHIINEHAGGTIANMDIFIDDNFVDDWNNREALYISNRSAVTTIDITMRRNRFGDQAIPATTAGNVGGSRDGVFIENRNGTMNLLIGGSMADANTIRTNNSTSDAIVEIESDNATSDVNVTMTHNTFASSGSARMQFDLQSDGNTICLDLRENNATNTGTEWELDENGGTFTVEGAGAGGVTAGQLQGAPHNNTGDFTFPAGAGTVSNNGNTNCTNPS